MELAAVLLPYIEAHGVPIEIAKSGLTTLKLDLGRFELMYGKKPGLHPGESEPFLLDIWVVGQAKVFSIHLAPAVDVVSFRGTDWVDELLKMCGLNLPQ